MPAIAGMIAGMPSRNPAGKVVSSFTTPVTLSVIRNLKTRALHGADHHLTKPPVPQGGDTERHHESVCSLTASMPSTRWQILQQLPDTRKPSEAPAQNCEAFILVFPELSRSKLLGWGSLIGS